MEQTIKFNKKALEGKTQQEFIEIHKGAYPDLDLASEYEKLFPGQAEKPKIKTEKEAK